MAQRAEPLNPDPNVNDPSQITSEPEIVVVTESLQMVPIETSASDGQSIAQRAGYSLSSGIAKVRFWVEGLSDEFERMRADDPMKLVAITAGAAFVLGALIRVWRSNHE